MDNNYKVYALPDTNKCIIGVESTAFHDEQELIDKGYVFIDEGSNGEIYGHAQPNYLKMKYGKPTYDEQFHPKYILDGGVRELTDEEKVELFPKPTPQPTEQELINAQLMLEIAKLKAGV